MTLEEEMRRYLVKALRVLFRQSPIRDGILERRKTHNGWACEQCKVVIQNANQLHVDHIEPAVKTDGPTSSYELVQRMFCITSGGYDDSGFQLICVACHRRKTGDEMQTRIRNKLGPYEAMVRNAQKRRRAIIATRLADGAVFGFESVTDCCKTLGVNQPTVSLMLTGNGVRRTQHKGYVFRYRENVDR